MKSPTLTARSSTAATDPLHPHVRPGLRRHATVRGQFQHQAPVAGMSAAITYWHETDSPVGRLLLAGSGECLQVIHFQQGRRSLVAAQDWVADRAPFRDALAQLEEYFAAERRAFDLPLAPEGTVFQRSVWRELAAIPYGETISYTELARRIGNPRAVRAVGLANGANPLPIVIPCHRVIGANGSLTGFGGGLDAKRWLLSLERSSRVEAVDGGR